MAWPLILAGIVVGAVQTIISRRDQDERDAEATEQYKIRLAETREQLAFDITEAGFVRDEEIPADLRAIEANRQAAITRISGGTRREIDRIAETERIRGIGETMAGMRLAEEERLRLEDEQIARERLDFEEEQDISEFDLEVTRLAQEAQFAYLEAEEAISGDQLKTIQAQADITRYQEINAASQVAGFASRGVIPGSASSVAVMKRSADLAETKRMELTDIFELFSKTRRAEALRVEESGALELSQLGKRLDLRAESREQTFEELIQRGDLEAEAGAFALKELIATGDLAAEAEQFSLRQFKKANEEEFGLLSTSLRLDIETVGRKADRVDRGIIAMEASLANLGQPRDTVRYITQPQSAPENRAGFFTGGYEQAEQAAYYSQRSFIGL